MKQNMLFIYIFEQSYRLWNNNKFITKVCRTRTILYLNLHFNMLLNDISSSHTVSVFKTTWKVREQFKLCRIVLNQFFLYFLLVIVSFWFLFVELLVYFWCYVCGFDNEASIGICTYIFKLNENIMMII